MSDRCPKCGAAKKVKAAHWYQCGTFAHAASNTVEETPRCLRNQLAASNEVIAKLPKCWRLVDGVLVQDCPVVPEQILYYLWPHCASGIACFDAEILTEDSAGLDEEAGFRRSLSDCYSTAAAAEAAKGEVK